MGYRRRASPLHAARAAVGCGVCGALALVALLHHHPLLLAAAVVAAAALGAAAGVGRELLRTLALAVPFALVMALVNPLVSREGLTVVAWLDPPALGPLDITLEATVHGGVLGLRALALIGCFALFTLVVDPDEVLRLLRGVSLRSALTATLATRMVPLLARDGRRIAEAQRCRPGPPPSRVAIVRTIAAGALERAVDVAAALEVRGYAGAGPAAPVAPRGRVREWRERRRPRRSRWSRHDRAFAAAGVALLAVALAGPLLGAAGFETYPRIAATWDLARVVALALAVVAVPLLPSLDRRGIER